MGRTIKLYKLPEQPQTAGLRPFTHTDVPQVRPASQQQAACAGHAAASTVLEYGVRGSLAAERVHHLLMGSQAAAPAPPHALRPRLAAQVTRLLATYLARFKIAPEFSEGEVEHYLLPVEDVICTYVVESPSALPAV